MAQTVMRTAVDTAVGRPQGSPLHPVVPLNPSCPVLSFSQSLGRSAREKGKTIHSTCRDHSHVCANHAKPIPPLRALPLRRTGLKGRTLFHEEPQMAKRSKSLASMSVETLLKMRDDIGRVLSQKAEDLKQQLSRLSGGRGGGGPGRGRRKRGSVKGRKVPPKYRGPGGETWAGRGARPRWMQEQIKAGAKQDDFLINKPGRAAASRKKGAAKRSRKRKTA
jgi:DNA-binding protein H-NS